MALPAAANTDPYQVRKNLIVKFLRKNFESQLSFDLFTAVSDRHALDLREKLTQKAGSPYSQDRINALYKQYIDEKFKTKELLERKLKAHYLDEKVFKQRFEDNIVLSSYFSKSILPRVFKRLEKEEKLYELAQTKNLSPNAKKVRVKYLDIAGKYGGEKGFELFLENSNIPKEDFVKSLEAEELIEEYSLSVFNERQKSPENYFFNADDMRRYYNNRFDLKYKTPAKYYFSQIFVPLSLGEEKANEIYDELILGNSFEGVEGFEKVAIPSYEGLEIYPAYIQDSLEFLDETEISSVIKSPKGFYILRLDHVEAEEAISFEDVRLSIYQEMRALELAKINAQSY